MSTHAYSEDQLVEQPTIGLFAELGWQTLSAREELFGPGGTLGREASGEVVLLSRFRAALEGLNPALPPDAIKAAGDDLTPDASFAELPHLLSASINLKTNCKQNHDDTPPTRY